MGGWVGSELALDFRKRDKSLAPARIRTLDWAASVLVTILTTLFLLLSKIYYVIYLTYIICWFLVRWDIQCIPIFTLWFCRFILFGLLRIFVGSYTKRLDIFPKISLHLLRCISKVLPSEVLKSEMIPLQQRTASVAARKYERIYYSVLSFLNKVWQSKVHPRTGHEDPERGGADI